MQRNMDLVRIILLRMEGNPSGWGLQNLGSWGFSAEDVGYHCHIMAQEGLIEGADVTSSASRGPQVMPRSITWKGHEFLDLARDQERWNRAKAIITKVGSAPIAVWEKVLTDLLLRSVETAAAKPS